MRGPDRNDFGAKAGQGGRNSLGTPWRPARPSAKFRRGAARPLRVESFHQLDSLGVSVQARLKPSFVCPSSEPQRPLTPAPLPRERGFAAERREQRLRLGDLGHFRRRRKAFERGREDAPRLDRAAGALPGASPARARPGVRTCARPGPPRCGGLLGMQLQRRRGRAQRGCRRGSGGGTIRTMAAGSLGERETVRDRRERVVDRARRPLELGEKALPHV